MYLFVHHCCIGSGNNRLMELFFRFFLCDDVSVSTDYVRRVGKSLFYLDTKMGRWAYNMRWARTMDFKTKLVELEYENSWSENITTLYTKTWNKVKGT